MSLRFPFDLAPSAAIALLCSSPHHSQGVYGAIQGTIRDNSGALVPDADVSVREISTGFSAAVQTKREGIFVLTSLRPGVYALTARRSGFSDVLRPRIDVRVGDQISLELALSVSSSSSTVSVTAEAPLVHTDDTLVGSVIDEQTIKQLPLSGRNAFDSALLTPGVTQSCTDERDARGHHQFRGGAAERHVQNGVRGESDVDAFATRAADNTASVMLWNYHDVDIAGPVAPATVTVAGMPATAKRVLVTHYRIDDMHSNAYTVWKAMGSPQHPTSEQYSTLQAQDGLQLLTSPEWMDVKGGAVQLSTTMPRQSISLIALKW